MNILIFTILLLKKYILSNINLVSYNKKDLIEFMLKSIK